MSNDPLPTVGRVSSDASVIVDTAIRSAEPHIVTDDAGGRMALLVTPAGGRLEQIDLGALPSRKSGFYTAHNAESLLTYLSKHGRDVSTEVWASENHRTVVAVLNDHTDAHPGWGDHRITYLAEATDPWKAWIARDGELMSQSDFAELIEDRAPDVVDPSAADMLELAQSFQATVGVRFESSKLISSGERQLEYREQVEAKAGRAGRLEIPQTFTLALQPINGSVVYKVAARLRYRINDGQLRIGYRLEQPDEIARDAFAGVVKAIQEGLSESGIPVLHGQPSRT